MYNTDEYEKLTSKYGPFASWAIWDCKNECNSLLINENINQLHSKFVFLGLNISRPLVDQPWSNFHGGKHDRKIKYACSDNKLHGSYLTDIFKGIDEQKSTELKSKITDEIIKKNVDFFHLEMEDIKINKDTQFVVFGTPTSLLAQYFETYFRKKYKNRVIYHYHYSYYKLTDREWVNGLWKELGIDQDFDSTVKKYRQ